MCVLLGVTAFVLTTGCEDKSTLTVDDFSVRLVDRLEMTWNGSDVGVPYRLGNQATFSARTNAGADWRLEIRSHTGARWIEDHELFQTRYISSWDSRQRSGDLEFAAGDTCVVRIETIPELHPDDAELAEFIFIIDQ